MKMIYKWVHCKHKNNHPDFYCGEDSMDSLASKKSHGKIKIK